jgi:N-acylneuraminate cytidylyltransferase
VLAGVALVVFDFDGVMTDNRVLVLQDGTEGVLCSRADGYGLEMLRHAGVPAVVLSKEQNPVVAARCRKLKLECVQGIDDKLPELKRLAAARGAPQDKVAYVGNDVNDLECLAWAGAAVVVADAHPKALAAADLVLGKPGGHGAVRELCEMILETRTGATGGGI